MPDLSNSHASDILAAWSAVERATTMPNARQRDDFRAFADWCDFYDVAMPASGEKVGEYLLELLADGSSLALITRAAESIACVYQSRRHFLDPAPVKAALAVAAAQLSPNRILH
jgi:hypothetical protein